MADKKTDITKGNTSSNSKDNDVKVALEMLMNAFNKNNREEVLKNSTDKVEINSVELGKFNLHL